MEDDSETRSLMSDSLKVSLLSGIRPSIRRTAVSGQTNFRPLSASEHNPSTQPAASAAPLFSLSGIRSEPGGQLTNCHTSSLLPRQGGIPCFCNPGGEVFRRYVEFSFRPGLPFFRFLPAVDDVFRLPAGMLFQQIRQADPVIGVAFFRRERALFAAMP